MNAAPHLGRPRGSTLIAATTAALILGLAVCAGTALVGADAARARRDAGREVAAALGLTDVALFGEARYTRNRSLADLASPFQDGPMLLDHFPAGSLATPPRPGDRGRLGVEETDR